MNLFESLVEDFGGYIPQSVMTTLNQIVRRDDPTLGYKINSFMGQGGVVDTTILNAYRTYNDIRQMHLDLKPFRYFYLVQAALMLIKEEALAADPNTGDIFKISVDEKSESAKDIERCVEELKERFDLEAMLDDVMEDALFNGEYSYRLEIDEGGDGIVNILDTVTPGTVISLHRKHLPMVIYEIDGAMFSQKNPWDFWHFIVTPQKIRIDRDLFTTMSMPYHFRIGQPMFYHLLPQLKELAMIEIVDVAKDIADLTRSSLVGVQMQHSLDPSQQKIISKWYEKEINRSSISMGQDNSNILEQANRLIMDMAKIKVIPKTEQRGAIDPIQLRSEQGQDRLPKINDRREAICTAVGIPFDMIFGRGDVGSGVALRQFARFQKRVKMVQRSCAGAIRQLITIHCAKRGVSIKRVEDIRVNFSNAINTTEIDSLEFQDTKIQMAQTITDYFSDLKQGPFAKFVKDTEVMKCISGIMQGIKGAENIVDLDGKQKTEEPGSSAF